MMGAVNFGSLYSIIFLSLSGCGDHSGQKITARVSTDPTTTAATTRTTGTCLEPSQVLLGVNYTCADGRKKTGAYQPPQVRDCASEGDKDCYLGKFYMAVDPVNLTPAILKKGVVLAGVTGEYPSVENPLEGATVSADLTELNATMPAGTYEFFDSAGTRHSGAILDAATIVPSGATQSLTGNVGLFRSFAVSGVSSVAVSNCAADGEINCVAVSGFTAAATSGLASKVLSGQTVAGVAGNVTLPSAANVRSSATFEVSGGTSGALLDCSADGSTGCVAVSAYTAATTSSLASKVLFGQTVAGVAGNITLPAIGDVRSATNYGVSGTGLTGTMAGATADCTGDGQSNCKIPSSGTLKSAETANFTGWDIRKTRNSSGTVLTFGGLTSQAKSHCRNQARTGLWDNTTSPGISGLDFFDTIDDYNNKLWAFQGVFRRGQCSLAVAR